MSAVLDAFMPEPDVQKRQSILVRAPAGIVFDVARQFDMQSVPLVRAIFRLRARLLGARAVGGPTILTPTDLLRMGWGTLAERPGRFFIAGAACQPWQANVVFTPIEPDRFQTYAEPDRVKIAWTLEAEPRGPSSPASLRRPGRVAPTPRRRYPAAIGSRGPYRSSTWTSDERPGARRGCSTSRHRRGERTIARYRTETSGAAEWVS
jgi:hypothetical protein